MLRWCGKLRFDSWVAYKVLKFEKVVMSMDKVWTLHLQVTSPLREMIRQEAKDTGETFAAVVRKRLLKSYQNDKEKYEKTSNSRKSDPL